MIGSTFGHYKILSRIGGGNTGVVYKAFDSQAQRHVALKILQNDILVSKETRARFTRESQAAIILHHPAICQLYEVGEFRGHNYLAMEYVSGETFAHILEENGEGLALERFFQLVIPVLDGIGYAHQRGMVHRDIKPDNLVLNADGEPKVLDFGLVKFLDSEDGSDDESFRTMTGMVLGSASYMSPEQARGEELDVRSDVFSMGILMYEMLTGKNPFDGPSPFATMTNILNATPISPELLNPDIPLKLSQVVLRCLDKDMDRRFADVNEVLTHVVRVKDAVL